MLAHVLRRVHDLAGAAVRAFRRRLANALRPATTTSLLVGAATDLLRGKPELVAENALLRQQLIVLARSTKRPLISRCDRALLLLLASRVRAWRQPLLIVQPATLLRWHRAGQTWASFLRTRGREILGVRLPAADRPAFPARVRLLPRRAGLAPGRPRRRHPRAHRRLGRPAAPRGDGRGRRTPIPGPRPRRQVRLGVRPRRRGGAA